MSFILDALRKSETERQRSAVPSVTRVPLMAVTATRLPGWALGLIVLLAAGVLAMGAAWWQHLQRAVPPNLEAAANVPAAPPAEEGRSARETQTAERARAVEEAPGAEQATAAARREPGAAVPLRALAEPASAPPSQRAQSASSSPATNSTPQTRARIAATSLPTAEELARDGVALPALEMQLHGYGDEPSQRLVVINGNMYEEGDTLNEGPRLLSIDPDGAVLDHQGTGFRLPRE